MPKRPFTTRIDAEVLALAGRLATAERRSVTAVLELAVIEYARTRGLSLGGEAAPESDQPSADQ